ncbi:MAG: chalcone isomerase family protein [Myxococcota bacterium]
MDERRLGRRSGSPGRWLRSLGLALVCAGLFGAAPGRAAEIEGVPFRERIAPAGTELELHGVGLFRYRTIFRAYVAGLYLPADVPSDEVLSDVPKRLELSYFWAIDGEDFGRAADRLLERQLTPEQLAPLRARLDELHRAYRSIEPGHRYAITYTPGIGTELAHNGEPIALIPGADFAEAYFGIWLGETAPLDAGLRARLLGGAGTGRSDT